MITKWQIGLLVVLAFACVSQAKDLRSAHSIDANYSDETLTVDDVCQLRQLVGISDRESSRIKCDSYVFEDDSVAANATPTDINGTREPAQAPAN